MKRYPPTSKASPTTAHVSTRHFNQRIRPLVFQQHGYTCWICGDPGANQVDHVLPVSLGGTDDLENLRPAHASCNASRGARLP